MAVTTRMEVDSSSFKSGIEQARNSLRTLDAELKKNEAQYKATGDAETYLQNKSKTLQSQLQAQKSIISQAENALKAMKDSGVVPTDAAYQKMERTLLQAQTAMYDIQGALQNLDGSQMEAAGSADKLAESVNGISHKVSLDAVIGGIGKITDGLEKAAQKAIQVGEAIWDNIMTSARWGDDIATQAMMYQMTVEDFQKISAIAATSGETSVDSLLKSWKKLKMNLTSDADGVKDAFRELGIATEEVYGKTAFGGATRARDYMDVFWEIGDALMHMSDASEQERLAQTLLGRSWEQLIPMFTLGREQYEEMLQNTDTVSEESVNNLAVLNDKIIEVEQQFNTLKNEIIGQIAPDFTKAAETISGLLGRLNDYLKTDDGQAMLRSLGDAVGKLFDDLGKIDPEDVVNNFVSVFNKLKEGFEWISDHWGEVKIGLIGIGAGFGLLKISETVLTFMQLVASGKFLFGASGAAEAAAAGTSAGSAWGGAFAAAVKSAVPVLAPLLGLGAAGYAGAKMIEANLNDKNLNAIYGHGDGEGGIIDTMSDSAAKAAKEYWDVYGDTGSEAAMEARDRMLEIFTNAGYVNAEQGVSLVEQIFDNIINENDIDGMGEKLLARWETLFGEKPAEVPAVPEVSDTAAADIEKQIGEIVIPATVEIKMPYGGGGVNMPRLYANGISYVPFDGVHAILHKGERVMPAREVGSRSFSSNLYVESMYMSGGMDADALGAAIAERNRRVMSGFGS